MNLLKKKATAQKDPRSGLDPSRLPQHIAIIMDGNGRWAKKRGLHRVLGHRFGMKRVKEIVRACGQTGIKYLTLYAFSKENWKRPRTEVRALMVLLRHYLKSELRELQENRVRLLTIGATGELPSGARAALQQAIRQTADNQGLTLILALNYSARAEIAGAAKKILALPSRAQKKLRLDEKEFGSFLSTAGIPDPDLLIRTSGEMRLSNFLLWQLAYTEIWVTPVLWPDFTADHLYQGIREYQKRERRFGGVEAQ